MRKSKSVLVHLLDLTDNTQAHRNSDTGIKNHCCVIFPSSLSILAPEGRVQFNLLSAFSLLSVPPLAAECGPSCASSGSCLPRCVIGGWGPFVTATPPPRERRPARFHNFCEHDAGRYLALGKTDAQILKYCADPNREDETEETQKQKKQRRKKTSASL